MRSFNPGTSGLLRWLSLLLAFAAAGAANALLPSNLTARGRPSGSSGRSEVETSEAARGSVRPPRPSSRKSSSPSPRRDIEVDAAVLGHGFELGTNGSRTYALSSEERAGLARLFNTVDHDGDGGVDPGELTAFLAFHAQGDGELAEALHRGGDRNPTRPGSGIGDGFGDNGGGSGDEDSGDGADARPAAVTPVELLFKTEDRDSDGKLSRVEFDAALVAWSAEVAGDGDRNSSGDEDWFGDGDSGREEDVAADNIIWREMLHASESPNHGPVRGHKSQGVVDARHVGCGDDADDSEEGGGGGGRGGAARDRGCEVPRAREPPDSADAPRSARRRHARHTPANAHGFSSSNIPVYVPAASRALALAPRPRRRRGDYGVFNAAWTPADQWALAVASPACVLCVTGHAANCGPPAPPGCEDLEFRRVGLAAQEARDHAALIGGFLRRRGLTHE